MLKDYLKSEMRRRRLCFPLVPLPPHSPCSPAGKLTSAFFSTTDVATSGLLLDEGRMKVGREDLFFCSSWYSGMLRLLRPGLCPRRLEKGRFKSLLAKICFTWPTSGYMLCRKLSGRVLEALAPPASPTSCWQGQVGTSRNPPNHFGGLMTSGSQEMVALRVMEVWLVTRPLWRVREGSGSGGDVEMTSERRELKGRWQVSALVNWEETSEGGPEGRI